MVRLAGTGSTLVTSRQMMLVRCRRTLVPYHAMPCQGGSRWFCGWVEAVVDNITVKIIIIKLSLIDLFAIIGQDHVTVCVILL